MTHAISKKRVCLDNVIFGLQRYGGISNYWMRIAHAMANRTDLDTLFVTAKYEIALNVRSSPLPYAQLLSENVPIRLSRYLSFDCGECDVAHTSYYRVPRRPVKKYVVTAYDFMYERYRKGPARLVHTWQKQRSLAAADVVSCISSFTRDEALELMPMLDPAKLVVIPLGVDTKMFYPELNNSEQAPTRRVVFVGQRGGYKRFDLALGAVAQIPDLTLSVVGPAMTKSEKERAEKIIPGRWTEHGQIDTDALRNLYSTAFAFIYPSDSEGFGLPILEAMASGCPVVCSNLGSLPEVGGEAALFAEVQDPMAYSEKLRLLESDGVRKSIIKCCAANVARFTWERTIRETLELYDY